MSTVIDETILGEMSLPLWKFLHAYAGVLFWVTRIAYFPVLVLVYRRIRAKFVLLVLTANLLAIVETALMRIPRSPDYYDLGGMLLALLWAVRMTILGTAGGLCFRWFWQTRQGPLKESEQRLGKPIQAAESSNQGSAL